MVSVMAEAATQSNPLNERDAYLRFIAARGVARRTREAGNFDNEADLSAREEEAEKAYADAVAERWKNTNVMDLKPMNQGFGSKAGQTEPGSAKDRLTRGQAQARLQSAKKQEQAVNAVQTAGAAEASAHDAAAAKKKSEQDRRKIVRPMQKALWSTGAIGSETVILPILAYPLWGLWKLADIYKTKTNKDIGIPIVDEFVVPFGFIDWLQFIMGLFGILFIFTIIGLIFSLIVYFFIDPAGFSALFSSLVEIFQFLFP